MLIVHRNWICQSLTTASVQGERVQRQRCLFNQASPGQGQGVCTQGQDQTGVRQAETQGISLTFRRGSFQRRRGELLMPMETGEFL
jgi:hypothetical protein